VEVKSLLALPENAGRTLRVFVEQGAVPECNTAWSSTKNAMATCIRAEWSWLFWVDMISAQYLRGTVVDFSNALTAAVQNFQSEREAKLRLRKIL